MTILYICLGVVFCLWLEDQIDDWFPPKGED